MVAEMSKAKLHPLLPILCLVLTLGCGGESEAERARSSGPPPELGGAALGDGFVVWESKRSGDWRIWTRRLDGSGLRQLSPGDDPRQHCCPHISPDGKKVVYLARGTAVKDSYPEPKTPGALFLIEIDGGAEPVSLARARPYGYGNRAVVWHGPNELAHVDEEGRTLLLDLSNGRSRVLVDQTDAKRGWLPNRSLDFATTAVPTFSPLDAERGRVAARRDLGGCEPYFSFDGRWGYWVAAAGGPVNRIDLESREISSVLKKSDPRMPADRGYLYFPMYSHDGRLLAFGASNDEHDQSISDYDVFVAPSDPGTLELTGDPVRMTAHPSTDRFPDVYAEPLPPGAVAERAPPPPADEEPAAATGDGASWPSDRRGLAFLWQTGRDANLVFDPESGFDQSYTLEPRGLARLDHDFAMILGRGAFEAPEEANAHLLRALTTTNELTVEATVESAAAVQNGPARIVTFSSGLRRRNFTLGQEGRSLVMRVRTGETGPNADRIQVRLFDLPADRPVHVVVGYSPGRLVAYRDGELVLESGEIVNGFFPWKAARLTFGDEVGGRRDWSGTLEGVAIYDRVLEAAEVRENHRRYERLRESRPAVRRLEARGRLLAKSEIPTLRQISPYRQALVVYEYAVESVLEGDLASGRVRVAHWAILNGETLPVTREGEGAVRRLSLEPFAANPQLESLYLSDTFEDGHELPFFFDVEAGN